MGHQAPSCCLTDKVVEPLGNLGLLSLLPGTNTDLSKFAGTWNHSLRGNELSEHRIRVLKSMLHKAEELKSQELQLHESLAPHARDTRHNTQADQSGHPNSHR